MAPDRNAGASQSSKVDNQYFLMPKPHYRSQTKSGKRQINENSADVVASHEIQCKTLRARRRRDYADS
jgi:hypothetical protein